MRFLIGILTGSAVMLVLATGIGRFSGDQAGGLSGSLEPAWTALIDSVSARLFPPRADNPEPVQAEHPAASPSTAEPAIEPAAPLPMMSEPGPPPTHPPPDQRALPVTALAASEPLPREEREPLIATVWVPFHSQRSAEGFASRLSRELEHPFHVRRRGAGAYDVIFGAEDEIEQAELLARIAEVTGQ